MRDKPFVTEISVKNSPKEIWNAITVKDQMIQWFFENIPDFKAEVGFYTEFPVSPGERSFTHQWTILDVVPLEKITYNWEYEEYTGNARVSFEIIDKGEHRIIRLTNFGLHTFPEDIPEFTYESCKGGWEYFINSRLKSFLEE